MKIQYISDIHLEFYKDDFKFKLIPSAPILCLCGDIGYPSNLNYINFLKWCSENYKKIFLITGNHEYYDTTSVEETDRIIEELIKPFTNITFLNNKVEKYEELTFVGCVLWSEIPLRIKKHEIKFFNDFKKIKLDNNIFLTKETYNLLHQKDLQFLKDALKNNKNIICLTHHMPSYKMIHKQYEYCEYNFLFASFLDYLIKDNVKVWLCGHSHVHITININNVICTLNPFGYPDEHCRSSDCLNKTITI
jgi:predicted phosphodiesterase